MSILLWQLNWNIKLHCRASCRVYEAQVRSIENWKAEEQRRIWRCRHKNGAWLVCLSGLIYISGEERDRVCNQRVAPPGSKSSSPPVDCAICVVAHQRGIDRRPSSRVEAVSRWKFNYSSGLAKFIHSLIQKSSVNLIRGFCSIFKMARKYCFEFFKFLEKKFFFLDIFVVWNLNIILYLDDLLRILYIGNKKIIFLCFDLNTLFFLLWNSCVADYKLR